MEISEQQIVESCRAWFQENRRFFNFENIAAAISDDLRPSYFGQWVFGSDVLNSEDEVAVVAWAKEHGFRMGTVEPIQAEFTIDAERLKAEPGLLDAVRMDMARKLGLHLLGNGFLEFQEMGDVTKPGEWFRRTLGFRLVGRAVKLPNT